MRVYRYLSELELEQFASGDLSEVGDICHAQSSANTHNCKPGVRYLYFFKHLKDLDQLLHYNQYSSYYLD